VLIATAGFEEDPAERTFFAYAAEHFGERSAMTWERAAEMLQVCDLGLNCYLEPLRAGLNAHDVRQAVAHLVHHVMGHVAVDCPIGGIVGDELDVRMLPTGTRTVVSGH
jgi:hypothetical protein